MKARNQKYILLFLILSFMAIFAMIYVFFNVTNAYTLQQDAYKIVAGTVKNFEAGTKFTYDEVGPTYEGAQENEYLDARRLLTMLNAYENPLETVEISTEQNYNMIDGVINNTPNSDALEELEKAKQEVKKEKQQELKSPQVDSPSKRPSVLAQLRRDKQPQSNDVAVQKDKSKDIER